MLLTIRTMFDILLHKQGEIDMSDRGTVTLTAVCSDGMEVKALLKLIETVNLYGLEEDNGAQAVDIGYIDSSTWLVIARMSECNGIVTHKLADALDNDFKFKNPREVSILVWLESMQDFYDVWEGMPGEELKKYEENSEEPPTERAAKWDKLREQVCKWYSLEEFLEIPENMLV